MPRTSRKRQRKIHKLGKIILGLIVILSVILIIFVKEIVADKKESVEKTTTVYHQKEKTQLPSHQEERKKEEKKKDSETAEKKEKQTKKTAEQAGTKHQQKETKTDKVIYLTFDDGPHETASKDILQLLDKYQAKATFFMLEPHMKNNPDIVQEMKRKGHALGAHGVTHDISKVYQSPKSFVEEMRQGIDFIRFQTGIETNLVRAPYGSHPHITPAFKEASDQEAFVLWDWNIDSVDWKDNSGKFVKTTIQQTEQFAGKEPPVVLMHEKPATAKHLEKLLQYYTENGYEMRAIDEKMPPVQFK